MRKHQVKFLQNGHPMVRNLVGSCEYITFLLDGSLAACLIKRKQPKSADETKISIAEIIFFYIMIC